MILPLNDPNYFLFSKSFAKQCRLVLQTENPYRLFGLSQSASKREIIRVYRHLALHFHPDHHVELELAAQAMAKLSAAKEYLISPDNQSRSTHVNTTLSPAGQRIITILTELQENSPPRPNQTISLDKATDYELLCHVYWQRLENDTENNGKNMSLNPDLIDEIKSRIEKNDFGIFTEKYSGQGYTLLHLVARSSQVTFFEWLLNHAPDLKAVLNEQDNEGQTCVYHALANINAKTKAEMFYLICAKIDPTLLQNDLIYILRTAYLDKNALDLMINYLPIDYLYNNAASIVSENPQFLAHLDRFVVSVTKNKLVIESLKKNSTNYRYLDDENRANLAYIILAFLHPEGRSQVNIDALPLQQLSISFIVALTTVWPDLESKLALTLTNYAIMNNQNLYDQIKESWAYKLSKAENMRVLLAVNCILIISTAFFFLCLPLLAIPFVVITTMTLIAQAYGIYQWNDTRQQVNNIRFFQNNSPIDKTSKLIDLPSTEFYDKIQSGPTI